MITLNNCYHNKYIDEAIAAKKWVKACDYLRLYYLHELGGVYMDADMELLRTLDPLLDNQMFVCREENGFIANSAIGSVAGHPVLKLCLDEMDTLDGGNDKVFEYGMEIFSKHCYQNQDKLNILLSEFFFPYNHQTGIIKHTDNTYAYHHFQKSWL